MFLTTSVTDMGEIPREVCLMIHRNEYLDADFNKFRVLARARTPAASLARATEGRPERSRRYRELLHPSGNDAELRASQVVDGACWGALALYRKSRRPDFDEREADFLERLGPHLAAGLRMSLLAIAAGDEARPEASSLVVLTLKGASPR
jgi:GAF domain